MTFDDAKKAMEDGKIVKRPDESYSLFIAGKTDHVVRRTLHGMVMYLEEDQTGPRLEVEADAHADDWAVVS